MSTPLTNFLLKAKRHYHQIMFAYHYTLYRDCLDPKMKEKLFIKMKKHEKKI